MSNLNILTSFNVMVMFKQGSRDRAGLYFPAAQGPLRTVVLIVPTPSALGPAL